MAEYIDIEKDLIPYRFEISLSDAVFTFEIHYNSEFDFFTVDLERDGEILATGVKLVYGIPLFADCMDHRFPQEELIPFDVSGINHEVTWSTLGETIFLYVIEGDSDG
ncbi:phage baseplate plug family protein [Brevibacillus porteri]|uniref:phage baseplate plug family protein n=1 Tax=Brevibacillus porteri TaxID=2126350 RepID=UPI003D23F819